MLSRALRAAAAALLTTTVALAVADDANAAEHCDSTGFCYWTPDTPGDSNGGGSTGGGGNTGGGGGGSCSYEGKPVPCYVDGLGVWDGSCYVMRVPPPPGGRTDGYWTVRSCGTYGGIPYQSEPTWSPTPPGGILPSFQELAQQAIAQMNLDGPRIGVAPTPNGAGLVGLPIWMWTTVTPAAGDGPKTWGTVVRNAAVPGRSVTATARATKIVWDMGDGHTVTCTKPGTPYNPSYGNKPSPTCGYDSGYAYPSTPRPGGRYTITGTTTWQVTWIGGGGFASGSQTLTLSTTATIDIDELQVVTS